MSETAKAEPSVEVKRICDAASQRYGAQAHERLGIARSTFYRYRKTGEATPVMIDALRARWDALNGSLTQAVRAQIQASTKPTRRRKVAHATSAELREAGTKLYELRALHGSWDKVGERVGISGGTASRIARSESTVARSTVRNVLARLAEKERGGTPLAEFEFEPVAGVWKPVEPAEAAELRAAEIAGQAMGGIPSRPDLTLERVELPYQKVQQLAPFVILADGTGQKVAVNVDNVFTIEAISAVYVRITSSARSDGSAIVVRGTVREVAEQLARSHPYYEWAE